MSDLLSPRGPLFGAATAEHRDPRLPSFHVFEGMHPLCPDAKRVFIMLQDRTKRAMKQMFKYELSLEVPVGDDMAMDSLGEYACITAQFQWLTS